MKFYIINALKQSKLFSVNIDTHHMKQSNDELMNSFMRKTKFLMVIGLMVGQNEFYFLHL